MGSFLLLPGATDDYAWCLKPAGLANVNLDVRIESAADDWMTVVRTQVANWETTGDQMGWWTGFIGNGRMRLSMSQTGADANTVNSTAEAVGQINGQRIWHRMARTDATGDVAFLRSADGIFWSLVGVVQNLLPGVTPFNSNSWLTIGIRDAEIGATSGQFIGKIYRAEIRNDVDNLVASADFTTLEPGTTSFVDQQGNLWTLAGAASIEAEPEPPPPTPPAAGTAALSGVTLPPRFGDTWCAALDQASIRPARAVLIGDEVALGYDSTDRWNRSWPGLVKRQLWERWGHGGEGLFPVSDAPHVADYPPAALTETKVWGHVDGAFAGLSFTDDPGATLRWPLVRGNELVLWFGPTFLGSTMRTEVDDVEVGLTSTAVQANPVNAPYPVSLGEFGDGDHSVRFILPTPLVGVGVGLCGVEGRNRNGVRWHNCAHTDWASGTMNFTAYNFAVLPKESIGRWDTQELADPPLDLLVYALGLNDWLNAVTPATVETNMRLVFDYARAEHPTVDILVVVSHPGSSGDAAYTAIAARQKVVAADYGAAVVDMWERSGFDNNLPQYFAGSTPRPNDQGHAWYADAIGAVL